VIIVFLGACILIPIVRALIAFISAGTLHVHTQ
jgi:hypothetical protein